MNNPLTQISNALERYILSKAKPGNVFAEYYSRTRSRAEFKRQSTSYNAKEIKDWKLAIMSATDPDNPRRGDLMRFYQSLRLDNHLSSVIDTRILRVQRSSFKVVNANGENNNQLRELLERPWFEDLVRYVVGKTFNGTTLIEMFDTNNSGELIRVTEIPQSNFIATKGIIIKEEWDHDGVSYRNGVYADYYLQIGNDYELGMLNELAMIILAKKLGLGSWMSYIEKFGIPPIFVVTERMDDTRLNELFEMLKDFRSNHFGILQGNEKVEISNNNNMDGYQSFKSLNEFADNQISKRVLGGTASTDEKSFTGAALVQERVAQDRYEADKLLFKYYFNTHIRQRLVKLSGIYADFATHTLTWDNQETLSIDKYIDGVQKLSSFYDFDIEEVKNRTGLPITAVKQPLLPMGGDGGGQKKKPNVSLNGIKYVPFTVGASHFVAPFAATWDAAIERLANQIFNGEINPHDLDRDLVLKNYAALNEAAARAYGKKYYEDDIARKMRDNMMRFAGAKAHNLMQQLTELRSISGTKENFIEKAKQTVNLHNETWLNTERQFVGRSAAVILDWQQFQKDKDIYPNLTFRTMLDDSVRDEHAILEGITKPVDDFFWVTNTPPLGWKCRCWLEQTIATVTPENDTPTVNIAPEFAHNPATSGEIFSKFNNYHQSIPQNRRNEAEDNMQAMKQFAPYHRSIETAGNNKVFISDFSDPSDLSDNVKAAKKIADAINKNVYIRPHSFSSNGQKNPELGIATPNKLGDLKTFDPETKKSKNFDGFMQNALKDCNRKGCQYAIIDVTKAPDNFVRDLPRRLSGSLNTGRNKNIQQVIIIKDNSVYKISRKQVGQKDFTTLNDII